MHWKSFSEKVHPSSSDDETASNTQEGKTETQPAVVEDDMKNLAIEEKTSSAPAAVEVQ